MAAITQPAVSAFLVYLEAVAEDAVADGIPVEATEDALGETALLLAAALADLEDGAAWERLAITVDGYAGEDGAARVDALRAAIR